MPALEDRGCCVAGLGNKRPRSRPSAVDIELDGYRAVAVVDGLTAEPDPLVLRKQVGIRVAVVPRAVHILYLCERRVGAVLLLFDDGRSVDADAGVVEVLAVLVAVEEEDPV